MRAVLLSIKPKYVERIFFSNKRYELRRQKPGFNGGTTILVYSTKPDRYIIGHFKSVDVIEETIKELWNKVEAYAGMNYQEYRNYFNGNKLAYAIKIAEPVLWGTQISLEDIRCAYPGYNPPQTYHYLDRDHPVIKVIRQVGKENGGIPCII
ncbi:MAG: hypothetical protein QMC78_04035 [Methanocellales archaeon]|nr:hypothetical protein [Methanocellales archaeon]